MRQLFYAIILVATPAASAGMKVSMHAYNHCESGGDQSKWGDTRLKPSEYQLDTNPQYVMIAVSKVGGTNSLRGQCFKAVGGQPDGSKASQDMMSKVRSVTFVAADQCPDCSNKNLVDVSTSCGSRLNKNFTVNDVDLQQTDCPPDIQKKMKGYDKVAPQYASGSGRSSNRNRSSRTRYARSTR